jgi:hypothetical protein
LCVLCFFLRHLLEVDWVSARGLVWPNLGLFVFPGYDA